ncbi:transcription elongation factor GreB [Aliivibrio finisterrensis]|uniref:Transcription elongation factor GreB n=1 Tax=Aliivibrio finisterrensis TaxID=511998 RepID=A0A6N6RRM2_9GAMM|nr:transcription elongation factor GreB [Aliivibrio finisterrensis]KAB2824222.1 transcription elongation factor GreB [Aliivibrio finisterrensis]
MKSNYSIQNLKNIINNSAKDEMLSSDLIITKRGQKRDAISFIGEAEFQSIQVFSFDDDIVEVLRQTSKSDGSTKIAIDISLIDRKSLAELFSIVARMAMVYSYEIRIIYTLAEYSPPSGEAHPNNDVKPVSNFFSGWSNRPGMPILSVVGLGYERDKAVGAVEFLESSEAFLYIPQSKEDKYYTDVIRENSRLMGAYPESNRFSYELESPTETIYSLDSVISANKNKYKIVLLPFGPKIFYALSLLSSIAHPEVSVWYVSGENEDSDSSQDRDVSDISGFSFTINYSEK